MANFKITLPTLAATLLILTPFDASAVPFTVDSQVDAIDANPGNGVCATATDVCSLRAAVMEANALAGADVIAVPAGTFLLTLGTFDDDVALEGDLDITSDLSIKGAGPTKTIIHGNEIDRVFHVDPTGSRPTVSLSDLTIRGGDGKIGSTNNGGGIFNQGAVLTVSNLQVTDNSADDGGGIANEDGGKLTVENSMISHNLAEADGGGISNSDAGSTLTVRNSTILGNVALSSWGGGISSRDTGGATTIIEDSTITGNYADQDGGGVLITDGTLSMSRSEVSYNIAEVGNGGGLFGGPIQASPSGILNVSNSTIKGNWAADNGGGVFVLGNGSSFTNTTINNNFAGLDGGGIDTGANPTNIQNNTISGNIADEAGGGLGVDGTNVVNITNSTIAYNFADLGFGAVDEGGGIDNSSGGTVNLTNSIISYNINRDDPENCGPSTTIASNGNNIDGDGSCGLGAASDLMSDPLLLALADNGGMVNTHAPFHESPAIDAADNANCSAADARGVTRPVDGDGNGSAICDIGAHEFEIPCEDNPDVDCDPTAVLDGLAADTQLATKKIRFKAKSKKKLKTALAAANAVIAYVAANGDSLNLIAGSTKEDIAVAAKKGKKQIKKVRKQAISGTKASYKVARKKANRTYKNKIRGKLEL